jgi:transposase
VKEYRYRAVPAQGHAAGGLIGAIAVAAARRSMGAQATTSFYLTVIANDGRKLSIGPAFRDTYEAIGQIVNKLHERLRPQVDTALPNGALFGPLRLSPRDVQYKTKEPIPLHDLVRAELRGQMLDIKRQGKMLSSVNVRSDKVPNVLLLVETMEKLGIGGMGMSQPNPQSRVRM